MGVRIGHWLLFSLLVTKFPARSSQFDRAPGAQSSVATRGCTKWLERHARLGGRPDRQV